MRVEYSLEVTAICPVDGAADVYRCRIFSGHTITAEGILAAVKVATRSAVFQEDLTQSLHRALACEVETVGWHSGVRTRVVCGGPG